MNNVDNINYDKSLETLKEIFENVNKWLHFAEAKNGALIGLNGVFLLKSVDFLLEIINGKSNGSILLVGVLISLFLVAILVALKSFFPNISKIEDKACEEEGNNNQDRILIFYLDISKYKSPIQYLLDIHRFYLNHNIEIKDLKRIEIDYSKEILINSKITTEKYKLFSLSLKLNFIAVFVLGVFILIA